MTPEIILGPPGTGKTTYLLEQMERELDRGVPPDRIGFVSFTRRAAHEAKQRAILKFGLKAHDLPWIRTLHSLCFRALGMNSSQVLEGKKLHEFGKIARTPISGSIPMDEGASFGFLTGDRILFMENLSRVRGITLRQQFDENPDGIPWSHVERLIVNLNEFKRVRGLMDYTDMLLEFVRTDWSARLEVLFVDEAQDLSMLQWRVVDKLAQGARRVAIAGDDDQAIYRWAGAAVDHFIGLPGSGTVLNHSWRVPPEIQSVALRVLRGIRKRRPKEWNPREGIGEVRRAGALESSHLDVNEDTLILARNTCFLFDDVIPYLHKHGILYEYRDHTSVRDSLLKAVRDWEKLRRGDQVMVKEAENIYNEMKVNEGFTWGNKKLPAWKDRDQLITIEDLKEAGGLLTTAIWHEALTRANSKEKIYMKAVLQHGQSLTKRPSIRVSTIHGAKGAQADHVILLTDRAWRTFKEADTNPDDEARTWYVGATRAKHKLTTIFPQGNQTRGYEFPANR